MVLYIFILQNFKGENYVDIEEERTQSRTSGNSTEILFSLDLCVNMDRKRGRYSNEILLLI